MNRLWSDEQADAFIEERVRLHQLDEPPHCSDEDVWAKPTKYALMKAGRKSAVSLHATAGEAAAARAALGAGYVEVRPGTAERCQNYCPVADYCPQWAADPRNPRDTTSLDLFRSNSE